MKAKYLTIWILLLGGVAQCHAEDALTFLYSHETQGEFTNVWKVSANALKKSLWHPGNEEPPVPLGKIVQLAKKWVVATGANTNCWVNTIEIRVLGENGSICYYNVLFGGVGYFGHRRRCILLMDGTIVEPQWLGKGPKDTTGADYDE